MQKVVSFATCLATTVIVYAHLIHNFIVTELTLPEYVSQAVILFLQ